MGFISGYVSQWDLSRVMCHNGNYLELCITMAIISSYVSQWDLSQVMYHNGIYLGLCITMNAAHDIVGVSSAMIDVLTRM